MDSAKLSRRDALRRMGLGAAALAAAACSSKPPAVRKPNFLVVLTDDQTVDEMSCYGNKILKTPNMDAIAEQGARFTNFFSTNSLCAPGRAALLSGAYSHINGIRGNSEGKDAVEKFNADVTTFPQALQKAGYKTAIVGKWHLQQDPFGFDYWNVLPGQGVYYDPEFIEMGERKKHTGYATDLTTEFALAYLDKVKDQPFCLLYWHKAPHRPFKPAKRHEHLYDDVEIPYPVTFDDDFATRKIAAQAKDMQLDVSLAGDYPDLPKNLSAEEKKKWLFQRMVKDHYRCVYGVDENLGKVLKWLDDNKLAEDTVVLYTSDNGYFLGEHGWYDKRFMYEPSLRLPLVVRYPRAAAKGVVTDAMAVNIDIAPTILDYAGVAAPATMQGRSLRPLLEGQKPADWRQSIYYAYYENSWKLAGVDQSKMTDPSFQYFTAHRIGPHRGVRNQRYKLIEYFGEGDYWELFDLEKDPEEQRNLIGDPAYAKIRDEMKQELMRLRQQYRDA